MQVEPKNCRSCQSEPQGLENFLDQALCEKHFQIMFFHLDVKKAFSNYVNWSSCKSCQGEPQDLENFLNQALKALLKKVALKLN